MLIHLSYHISIAMQFCKQMNVSCFMAKFTSASQRQSQSTIWRHKSCPIYLFNDHSQGWMCPLQSVQWLQRLAHHMATKTMKCVHPHMSSISTLAWPVCSINIVHVLLGWLPQSHMHVLVVMMFLWPEVLLLLFHSDDSHMRRLMDRLSHSRDIMPRTGMAICWYWNRT